MRPRTQYVTVEGRSVAYQAFGMPAGGRALVIAFSYMSHLDWVWADPGIARLLRRAATQGRVVAYDRGGVGLSDPVAAAPSMEERAEELLAVADAAGLDRFDLCGVLDGAAVAAYLAATRPERVVALALLNPWIKGCDDGNDPPGVTTWSYEQFLDVVDAWGEGRSLDLMNPSLGGSPLHRRISATLERTSAAPGTIRSLAEASRATDVTAVLPSIGAPTLVIANRHDRVLPIEQARFVAAAIPGARLAELDGIDATVQYEHPDQVMALVDEHFGTDAALHDPERVFRAVLFSDVVGSTDLVARLGDVGWDEVRRAHDAATRAVVDEHGGTEVKSTGDGFLVTFLGAGDAIACGIALVDAVRAAGVEVRVGVHAGELRLADDDDVTGLAVHVAARVCSAARAGEVLVTQAARDLAEGAPLAFADRGDHVLRGAAGAWRLHAATRADRAAVPPSAGLATRADLVQQAVVRRAPALGRGFARLARRRQNPLGRRGS